MTLKEARIQFTENIALLILNMKKNGFRPALAEGMDRLTTKDPTTDHMKNGLHSIGLAQDIDLYDSNGKYLARTEDHYQFGKYWETLDPNCRWGGRFSMPDGNHYSFAPKEIVGNRA